MVSETELQNKKPDRLYIRHIFSISMFYKLSTGTHMFMYEDEDGKIMKMYFLFALQNR